MPTTNPLQHVPINDPTQSLDFTFAYLVDHTLPPPPNPPPNPWLQNPPPGPLDPFAFADGAFDASFNAPLDFSFEDFIHDPATVAIDSGFGAAL